MNIEAKQTLSPEVQTWMGEIKAAEKRERDYRKDARRVVKIYEAEKKEDFQFNILYSNTETMLPALYSSTPRPNIEPRYKVTDQLPNLASQLTKRVLEFLLDTDQAEYSKFDDAITSAVLEALVPGRGVTRFKYDYTTDAVKNVEAEAKADDPDGDGDTEDAEASTATDSATPQDATAVPVPSVSNETICAEEVAWDRVLFGYAKKWKDVPWVAFEHFMNLEELKANFGATKAALIPRNTVAGTDADEDSDKGQQKEAEGEKLAHIYEIWDKSDRTVKFIAVDYADIIRRVNDPLKLKHFLPMPKPLSFFGRISSLIPQTLYAFYEEQAKELNTCTKRINMIMRALKVRGFYDATLDGLDELMKKEDNTLVPAENVSAMLQGQTLDKAIWLFPIEKLIVVLQQLYIQRQQIKDVIYEVTGISDIVRGAGEASETATQSNIKNQWGTIRLKRAQKEVQRYVKDCLRIMAELAFNHLSPKTLAKMTGMNLPTREQQAQAKQVQAQIQAQPPMPGQPPQQLPPELQQALSMPAWEDVLELLTDDIQRDYRIDIEANSTVDADAQEDKQDVAEFMNAMGQFLSGTVPLIEQGVMPFDVMKSVLLAITQRFRFGREVEDQIRNMTEPQKQGDPSEDAKNQAAQAQAQADLAKIKAQQDADQQEAQNRIAIMNAEMANKQKELEMRAQELAMKEQEMARQADFNERAHQQKLELMAAQHAAAKAKLNQQGKNDANV